MNLGISKNRVKSRNIRLYKELWRFMKTGRRLRYLISFISVLSILVMLRSKVPSTLTAYSFVFAGGEPDRTSCETILRQLTTRNSLRHIFFKTSFGAENVSAQYNFVSIPFRFFSLNSFISLFELIRIIRISARFTALSR